MQPYSAGLSGRKVLSPRALLSLFLFFCAGFFFRGVSPVFAVDCICTIDISQCAGFIVGIIAPKPDMAAHRVWKYNADSDDACKNTTRNTGVFGQNGEIEKKIEELCNFELDSSASATYECHPASQTPEAANWTCAFVDGGRKVCENFKDSAVRKEYGIQDTNQYDVEIACYDLCNGTNSTRKNCQFIHTLTCDEYQSAGAGTGYQGPPFSEVNILKSSAGELNKLGGIKLEGLIGRLIGIAMGIIGTIALIVLIYGGLLWMTARGNSGQVEKSQQTLLWGGVGLIVILTAYAIVSFVFQAFS